MVQPTLPDLEEDPDLYDGEPIFHPPFDLRLLCGERPPRRAVPVGAVRADRTDQIVAERTLTACSVETNLDRCGDVAPRRLAVDADRALNGALSFTARPAPEPLSYLDHRDLPERHGASPASASETQSNVRSAGVGGWPGWSHNWQRRWSHAAGKTSGYLGQCGWQVTGTRSLHDPVRTRGDAADPGVPGPGRRAPRRGRHPGTARRAGPDTRPGPRAGGQDHPPQARRTRPGPGRDGPRSPPPHHRSSAPRSMTASSHNCSPPASPGPHPGSGTISART